MPIGGIVDPTTGEIIPPNGDGNGNGDDDDPTHGGTRRCVEIRLSPTSGFVESTKTWQFKAILYWSDGETEDVTAKAKWLSSQPGVFSIVEDTGLGTGVSAGLATVSATHCGVTGYAQMQVEALCVTSPLDIVIVLDRSYSMHAIENPGIERIEAARDAALGLVNIIDFTKDKVALVSFAGEYIFGPPVQTIRDSRLDHELSNDKDSLLAAINEHFVIKEPYCLDPLGMYFGDPGPFPPCRHMQGSTGIGGGLEEAVTELNSGRHLITSAKVIVMISDGINNIVTPDPAVVSAAAMAQGIVIVIAALGIESVNHDLLKTYGTPGLYFPVDDGAGLSDVLSRIPYVICHGYGSYGYGYSSGDPGPGGPAGSLHGLRWEMPCNVIGFEGHGCSCVDPPDQLALMGGAVDQLYDVTLRIRGKVELKRYQGGTHDDLHLNVGGTPANIGDKLHNEYSLIVSDPPQTFWLNRWPDGNILAIPPEANWDQQFNCGAGIPWTCQNKIYVVDYQFTAQIRQGATVTLRAKSIDSAQLVDAVDELIPPGVLPDPLWYRGQFLQSEITAVSP